MVDQLAYEPIAEGELLRGNDTNKKTFASILYRFFLVMLCAAIRQAAFSQIKWVRTR